MHIAHVRILRSLDEKYAKSVISYLSNHDHILKTELQNIVKNLYSLNSLLEKLEEDGIISIEKKPFGKNITEINLTPKGREVAEQLKKAQEIAESPSVEIEESSPKIGITEEAASHVQELRLLYHTNVLDDHVTISEIPRNGGRTRIFNIYIKRNGHGNFRLWCEDDNSFDCVHVEVAWTYPQVQEMVLSYKGKTKICHVCGNENRENAKFCDNCGAKL